MTTDELRVDEFLKATKTLAELARWFPDHRPSIADIADIARGKIPCASSTLVARAAELVDYLNDPARWLYPLEVRA